MKPMNKMNITIALLAAVMCSTACGKHAVGPTDNTSVKIHRVAELNLLPESVDSHRGEEAYSVLEPIKAYMQVVPATTLKTATPIYARVKMLADSTFLLMYQNANSASTVYYSRSNDLCEWQEGQALFAPYVVTTPAGSDMRKYSAGDAVVLSNGDILAVAGFRANSGYRYYPECNGISIRRSTDNGFSWGEEQIIYSGTVWEPYLLELPNGKLQCYFTDAEPVLRNSGTSVVESTDGGATWSSTAVGDCYKVIRQYKYDNRGTAIYTDQMPSVRMLNDGHTLLGFMEARLEDDASSATSTYKMSLVYGRDDWKHLSEGETGPEDRQTNLFKGAAGYVAQFASGETVISCNIGSTFSMKLGSADGRTFNGATWASGWFQPFSGVGYWGSTEICSSHEIIGTMHSSTGIQIGKFYLNHRIDAPLQTTTLDGLGNEWQNDQALVLCSASDYSEVAIRAAHDADNLCLLVERSDRYLNSADSTVLYVQGCSLDALDSSAALKIVILPDGSFSCMRRNDRVWSETSLDRVKCKTTVVGTPDDGRSDVGYLSEIVIPFSVIGYVGGDYVAFDAESYDGDQTDTFTNAVSTKPQTWMRIKIK